MMRWQRLAVTAALVVWSGCVVAQTTPASHKDVMYSMRSNIVGQADLDGEKVTDVVRRGNCRTAITTARGTTLVDWSTLSNTAPRSLDGHYVIELRHDGSADTLSMEPGDAARQVSLDRASVRRLPTHSVMTGPLGVRPWFWRHCGTGIA